MRDKSDCKQNRKKWKNSNNKPSKSPPINNDFKVSELKFPEDTECKKTHNPTICCLQETLDLRTYISWKWKDGKRFHANGNQKQQRYYTYIKLGFDLEIDKIEIESYYIMIKWPIHIL